MTPHPARLHLLAAPPRRLALPPLLLAFALAFGCTPRGAEPAAREAQPTAPVAADPPAAQGPLRAAEGAVHLEVRPNYTLLDRTALPGEVNLLIRLRGDEQLAKGPRPALDLAIVLDRSGSMVGDKIVAVKQASLDLLKELHPNDRVTLISYSDDAVVHAERLFADAHGVDVLRQSLLPITADGGTALGPGLVRSLDLLEPAKRPDRDIAHVLLLSDGQANIGEARPEVLAARAADGFRRGVSVSTLGVGLDYNEDLMTKIADQGGGRYHFIKDNQAIPGVVADELAGLVATVASGMTLDLRLDEGVELVKVFGYPTTQEPGLTRVRIGSIAATQSRELVIRVRLPRPAGDRQGVGQIAVDFVDLTRDGARGHIEARLELPVGPDPDSVRRSEDTEVTVRVAEVESAAQLEEATRAMAAGNYDQAKDLLRSNIDQLERLQKRAPSAKIAEQIGDLQQAEQSVEGARHSEEDRKIFQKEYKAKAYSRGKGAALSPSKK
jgi:Ca-activated chloride channel family protein